MALSPSRVLQPSFPTFHIRHAVNNALKSLAKETAIYGLSSIVGRFLNYLLVPVYTMAMSAQSGGYGVVTNVYAWVALVLVVLTCGMETGYFRFAGKGEDEPMRVYATSLLTVGSFAGVFLVAGLLLLRPIAGALGYGEHPWYVGMMMIVVAMDAFQSIAFARLRYEKRALRFAALKLLFIVLNIGLNIVYYVGLKGSDVGWAFGFNLICTSVVMLCLLPELRGVGFKVDRDLQRRMLRYCLPLLVLGITGILNQVADKIIFPFVYPDPEQASMQLGIYGASAKIAMIMAMLTQAFRFAYEPFVFGRSRDKDNRKMYADAMRFFIAFTLLAYMAVVFYLDILQYLIGHDYRVGLRVVPIVMAAEICMGVYFNLSFWYKLTDQTQWGAYFSLTGCVVLIVVNVVFIPLYGYMACAWAGVCGYGVAMLLSYFVGQRRYKIDYDLRSIGCYVGLTVVLCAAAHFLRVDNFWLRMAYRTALLLIFVAFLVRREKITVSGLMRKRQ